LRLLCLLIFAFRRFFNEPILFVYLLNHSEATLVQKRVNATLPPRSIPALNSPSLREPDITVKRGTNGAVDLGVIKIGWWRETLKIKKGSIRAAPGTPP
jgi:hypothetical protein